MSRSGMLSEKSELDREHEIDQVEGQRPQARKSSSTPTDRAIARFSVILRTSDATRSVNSASEQSARLILSKQLAVSSLREIL